MPAHMICGRFVRGGLLTDCPDTPLRACLHASVAHLRRQGIALGPPLNVQGGWYFQNLETGDQLHARSWTELSVPDHVIQRVNGMAKAEGAQGYAERVCADQRKRSVFSNTEATAQHW